MRQETRARIVLGGRVAGYKGRMPGIAEEALLSLQAQQPVFLLGGFGGLRPRHRGNYRACGPLGRFAWGLERPSVVQTLLASGSAQRTIGRG